MDEKKKSALSAPGGVWEALGFLALSIGLILYCVLKQNSGIRYEWKLSPWLFPMLTAVFLLILSTVLLFRALRARRGASGGEEARSGLARSFAALGLTAAYTLALKFVPFAPATAVLLAVLLLLFGEKRLWALLLIPLLATALVWLVFGAALHVDLP